MNEPEYANRAPLPDVLHICDRCKRGVLVFLGTGVSNVYTPSLERPSPWCYVCGSKASGVAYQRAHSDLLGVWGPDPDGYAL